MCNVMELHCNLKNLMKILEKSTFLRKHTLNVAILHLLVYYKSILIYFSGQKWDFKMFRFFPIIKSMFFHYNLKKKGWRGKNKRANILKFLS